LLPSRSKHPSKENPTSPCRKKKETYDDSLYSPPKKRREEVGSGGGGRDCQRALGGGRARSRRDGNCEGKKSRVEPWAVSRRFNGRRRLLKGKESPTIKIGAVSRPGRPKRKGGNQPRTTPAENEGTKTSSLEKQIKVHKRPATVLKKKLWPQKWKTMRKRARGQTGGMKGLPQGGTLFPWGKKKATRVLGKKKIIPNFG